MYKMVATQDTQYSGVSFSAGDLFPQNFPSEPGGHPWNSGAWKAIEIPDEAKSDLYVYDSDTDALVLDDTLLSGKIIQEKNRLSSELATGYEERMAELAVGIYSSAERDSFMAKVLAAKDWSALDNNGKDSVISTYEADPDVYVEDDVILLSEIDLSGTAAAKRGQVDQLSQTILDNNAAWRKLIGKLTQDRKNHWNVIDNVQANEEGLDTLLAYSITWSV
jgi:hypothetical protein